MQYTADQKAEALQLWTEHGSAETVRRTGITRRTLTRWANAAGLMSQDSTEKMTAARNAAATRVAEVWGDYREKEAAAAGATASRLRTALLEQVEGEPILERIGDDEVQVGTLVNGRNLQSLAVAYGILVDKAELLSGHATERIETWGMDETDRSLRELVGEMEDSIRNNHSAPLES